MLENKLKDKANIDFLNIGSSAKELISKYGCPDFTRGIALTNNTTYVAEYPQYISAWIVGKGNSNNQNKLIRATLSILDDNNNIVDQSGNQAHLSGGDGSTFCAHTSVFVNKGVRYSSYFDWSNNITNLTYSLKCFPLIGV